MLYGCYVRMLQECSASLCCRKHFAVYLHPLWLRMHCRA
jgi:hypothetical protein